jgi:hypothetical protein
MDIRSIKESIQRKLKLDPIQKVLRKLKKRRIKLEDLDALEIFGYTGEYHTKFYAPYVRSLEVWEIDPACKEPLMRNLPTAEVKITDSYNEIKHTQKKFNFIVVDNPMSAFGNYCEHFDLFPDIFTVVKESSVLILNVIPEINDVALIKWPYLFNEVQLSRRRSFYDSGTPDKISFEELVKAYRKLCNENGFDLEWYFFQKRTIVYYLVIKILKKGVNL